MVSYRHQIQHNQFKLNSGQQRNPQGQRLPQGSQSRNPNSVSAQQRRQPQQSAAAVNPPRQLSNTQAESTSRPIALIVIVEVTINLAVSKSSGIQTGSTIAYPTAPLPN
ncbi:hypothetical protein Acr_00g0076600 [Actinidia rufa]|uniref:Uncharacterized protein n=1 Tax=Actinidia rufa TaxID=165716 RepID=A0A7J0DT14_9ERIC|nr:hypothetical protein Acr_00g0076600 [Actinidia rufa]